MTDEEWEKRRRFLKAQCTTMLQDEKIQAAFVKIRDVYSARIIEDFDPALSEKIDLLTKLIDD